MDNQQQSSNQDKLSSRRGRKSESSNVHIRPVFREEPDIDKLARAIATMIMNTAKKEMENPDELPND